MEKIADHQLDMALEAITFARDRKSISDYRKFCNIQTRSVTQSIQDRLRLMDFLLEQGFIKKAMDGELRLGSLPYQKPWFAEQLKNGSIVAWSIADDINPSEPNLEKFDSDRLKEIGDRGELHVFEEYQKELKPELLPQLKHVSLERDDWGFDIRSPSPTMRGEFLHLEVKTTSRPRGEFRLFLSSNEYRVGQQLKNWFIVLVRIIDNKAAVEGHFSAKQLSAIQPINTDERMTWSSVKILVSPNWITSGLPHIERLSSK